MMLDRIDINAINEIAIAAGKEIMKIYESEFSVDYKDDNSPLTIADHISNEIILQKLLKSYPSISFISEENKQIIYEERKGWEYFWLIDPLDGTKEFIKKNGEFTVNIALIHHGNPVMGVVYVPAKEELYFAKKSQGSYKIDGQDKKVKLQVNKELIDNTLIIAGSRSHGSEEMEQYLEEKKKNYNVEFVAAGSSLKFCLVAEGKAHEYPRFGPTMEWDTAAGHAVAVEAGAEVLDMKTMMPLRYNKEVLKNPFFIVRALQSRQHSML